MEDGVVNQILQGPLGDVFEGRQLITDVYGSGNNWSVLFSGVYVKIYFTITDIIQAKLQYLEIDVFFNPMMVS